jgi:hypothetical protein
MGVDLLAVEMTVPRVLLFSNVRIVVEFHGSRPKFWVQDIMKIPAKCRGSKTEPCFLASNG